MAKFGKSVPLEFRKEGVWTPSLGMYLIWFQYLQISPSYELARCYRAGLLSEESKLNLPSDFHFVLSVYDNLGDVWTPAFADWWQLFGIDNFGYHGDKPVVRKVAMLHRARHAKLEFLADAERYLDDHWQNEGSQDTMVVAIPTNLPKSKILKKVGQLIDTLGVDQKRLRAVDPVYKLHRKKHDEGSLLRYLEAVKCRFLYPDKKNWEIGAMVGLSQMYSQRLASLARADANTIVDDKTALKILTSRAIQRGRAIAENAARGNFPSYEPLPEPIRKAVSMNFSDTRMRSLILRREKVLEQHHNTQSSKER